MIILREYPPMFDKIAAAFPGARDRGVMFAWAGTVYLPSGGEVPPELKAHEEVHFEQQGDAPVDWWERYIASAEFRLEQEIAAHRAEFRCFKRIHADRNKRAKYLRLCAERLASPLYGSLLTASEARKEIA